MKKLSIIIALLVSAFAIAQVDVIPADGVLFDTKTSTVLNGIGNPREGLLVGNKTTHSLWYYNGTEFVDLMDVVGGTTYTAGDGIDITGSVISVDNPLVDSEFVGVGNTQTITGSKTFNAATYFPLSMFAKGSLFISHNGQTGYGSSDASLKLSSVSTGGNYYADILGGNQGITNTAFRITANPTSYSYFNNTLGISIGKNTTPSTILDVNGTITATSFIGDGSQLTGISSADQNASEVPIADVAGNFISPNVEGALEELYGGNITNGTLTNEVYKADGSNSVSLKSEAISNKDVETPTTGDYYLFWDASVGGALKKVSHQSLASIFGGGSGSNQNLSDVLTEGNDAGGLSISNLLGVSSEYITARRTSDPSPEEGRFYYNSFDDVLRVYTGGQWTDIAYADDVNADTGIQWDAATSKTMQIDDANKIFYKAESDNGIKQFIIPLDSNVSYDSDIAFTFNHEGGAGIIRVRGESGVNITPKRLNTLGTMSLIRRGIDNWVWIGAYEDDVNANPETYTLNNCLAIDTNTDSVDGLTAFINTTQASVANTSPEDVDYMWQLTSTAVSANTRGREVFIVENAKTYEVRFWVKGESNMAYRWESETTDTSYKTGVITDSWQHITEIITTTGVNPTLSFYPNFNDSGNIGDVVEVAGLTMKEIETGL